MSTPRPTDLVLHRASHALEVSFDDGTRFRLPCEYLRVESPSAEVQGHGPGQKVLVAGKRDVNIVAIEPIGNYAVMLRFDDGHDSGLYSWSYLHELGIEQEARWAAYLAALSSRDMAWPREPEELAAHLPLENSRCEAGPRRDGVGMGFQRRAAMDGRPGPTRCTWTWLPSSGPQEPRSHPGAHADTLLLRPDTRNGWRRCRRRGCGASNARNRPRPSSVAAWPGPDACGWIRPGTGSWPNRWRSACRAAAAP